MELTSDIALVTVVKAGCSMYNPWNQSVVLTADPRYHGNVKRNYKYYSQYVF